MPHLLFTDSSKDSVGDQTNLPKMYSGSVQIACESHWFTLTAVHSLCAFFIPTPILKSPLAAFPPVSLLGDNIRNWMMSREDSRRVPSARICQISKHLHASLSQLVHKWAPALITKQEWARVNGQALYKTWNISNTELNCVSLFPDSIVFILPLNKSKLRTVCWPMDIPCKEHLWIFHWYNIFLFCTPCQ